MLRNASCVWLGESVDLQAVVHFTPKVRPEMVNESEILWLTAKSRVSRGRNEQIFPRFVTHPENFG